METGKVKWYNKKHGWGFIERSEGDDLFVHYTEVPKSGLEEGVEVKFLVGDGPKGPCAKSVEVLSSEYS